jgi:hypothetical protein
MNQLAFMSYSGKDCSEIGSVNKLKAGVGSRCPKEGGKGREISSTSLEKIASTRYRSIFIVIIHDGGHACVAVLGTSALTRIKVTLAAISDLFVQACKLFHALAALDIGDRITCGSVFRICGANLENVFSAVFILPAIHSRPPFSQSRQSKRVSNIPL